MNDKLKYWALMLAMTTISGCRGPTTRINRDVYHRLYDDCMAKAKQFPDQDYISADEHCRNNAKWKSLEKVEEK